MDNRTLAHWNQSCASLRERIKGEPFPNAAIFVTKSTNRATLMFWAEDGFVSGVNYGIGEDQAEHRQIAREILAVAQQHGLINAKTEVLGPFESQAPILPLAELILRL
jgi:hypothetical protein